MLNFLGTLIAISALLVLLLAIPILLAFRFEGTSVEGNDAYKGHVTLRWLFGLVRIRFPVPGDRKVQASRTRRRTSNAQGKHVNRNAGNNVIAVLRQAAFRKRVYRLAKDLVLAANLHQLSLKLRLGLGDPSDTGRLWAAIGPLNAAAQYIPDAQIEIEPEFMEALLEFHVSCQARIVPLQFLGLAIAFACSPASIRAWRTLKDNHA